MRLKFAKDSREIYVNNQIVWYKNTVLNIRNFASDSWSFLCMWMMFTYLQENTANITNLLQISSIFLLVQGISLLMIEIFGSYGNLFISESCLHVI